MGDYPLWLSNANPALFLSRVRREIDIALQPIVDIHAGRAIAHECLIRGVERLGFSTIASIFDHAYETGVLLNLEVELQAKALKKFATVDRDPSGLLFLNLDGRLSDSIAALKVRLEASLAASSLRPGNICFEISEANQERVGSALEKLTIALKSDGYRVALDDYGRGHSGLKMLYQANPDFLKIDQFFIRAIEHDSRKRLFAASVVDLAHTLGVSVIAEGVETEEELRCCHAIRCDLVQGDLVARPAAITGELKRVYASVARSIDQRRKTGADALQEAGTDVATLTENARMVDVLNVYRAHPEQTVIPILAACGQPVGIIREQDIKPFLYSPFGRELLQNRTSGFTLAQFVRRVPIANVNGEFNRLLEAYHDRLNDGVLLVADMRYVGYLAPEGIVRIVNGLRLAEARSANPLTRLPGNEAVLAFVNKASSETSTERVLCYFDFDNFKPFNDSYGFRIGDRAILLFADLLNALKSASSIFIGHIGGDDFFAGAIGRDCEQLVEGLIEIQCKFADAVYSLYEPCDRERGAIEAIGRDGSSASFPLMTCSIAMLRLSVGSAALDVEEIGRQLAQLKKESKASPTRFAETTIRSADLTEAA